MCKCKQALNNTIAEVWIKIHTTELILHEMCYNDSVRVVEFSQLIRICCLKSFFCFSFIPKSNSFFSLLLLASISTSRFILCKINSGHQRNKTVFHANVVVQHDVSIFSTRFLIPMRIQLYLIKCHWLLTIRMWLMYKMRNNTLTHCQLLLSNFSEQVKM